MSIESIEGNMVSMKYVPSDEALKFIAKAKDRYGDKYNYDKVGKTFTTVAKRYYGNRLPYNWKVITNIVGTAEYISDLEEELHRNLNSAGYKYTPKKKFDGSNECYKCNYTEEINI